jgi:hypothetical protein
MIRDKEGNIVNKKEKVLQRWSDYYEKHFKLHDGTDNEVEMSGQCEYKLQKHGEPSNYVDTDGNK